MEKELVWLGGRVGSLQEKIKRDTKYEINDQVLLTKKGLRLRSDEKLDLFLNDPLLQSTMVNQDAAGRNKPLYVWTNVLSFMAYKGAGGLRLQYKILRPARTQEGAKCL